MFFRDNNFFSCTQNVPLTKVDPYPLIHGNASKMWVINKVMKDNVNYTPSIFTNRDVIFFFSEDFGCYVQPMESIGFAPNLLGTFEAKSSTNKLKLYFKGETWEFYMSTLLRKKIVLRPTEESDFPYELELIPYPKNFIK